VQMTACVDQEFDIPPGKEVQVEDISNTMISTLKATHTIGADATPIAAGTVIKGTVISDDNAGGFFKELIIQDASGGVLIRVNRAEISSYGFGHRENTRYRSRNSHYRRRIRWRSRA